MKLNIDDTFEEQYVNSMHKKNRNLIKLYALLKIVLYG